MVKAILLVVTFIVGYAAAKKASEYLFRRKDYKDGWDARENAMLVSYEEFEKFYGLNPDAWGISANGIVYRKDCPDARFALGYDDYVKCAKMIREAKRSKKKVESAEKVFDEIRADIRDVSRMSEEEIRAARKTTMDIGDRNNG